MANKTYSFVLDKDMLDQYRRIADCLGMSFSSIINYTLKRAYGPIWGDGPELFPTLEVQHGKEEN